jgi:CheY-like chemotaxis protein
MSVDPHKRVLVVDDDVNVRGVLKTVLETNGLTIDEASNGREALDLLAVNQYAVILLDLILPVLDGYAVIEAIGTQEMWKPVVLVVTGAERPSFDARAARWVQGVVRKPFDPLELANVVAACADLRGRSTFGTMAIAAMVAGSPLLALLNRW